MKSTSKLVGGIAMIGALAVGACGSDGSEFGANHAGGDLTGGNGTGGGGGFGAGDGSGDPAGQAGKECAAQEAQATLTKRPIDIIFGIDNSGSMGTEITEVQNQINENFAVIIGASGVDYRVIMVTHHGTNPNESVCISAPLSGTSCSPVPQKPVETARFFHHSTEVASTNVWCKLLTEFSDPDDWSLHPSGWGSLLRTEAFKVFVTITDDRVATSCTVGGASKSFNDGNTTTAAVTAADAFDAALLALSPAQFGTAANRNYLFHTIAGLAYADPADKTKATLPGAPLTTATCGVDAVNAGLGHQALSIKTGGLRYPSCAPAAGVPQDYSPIFKEMAKGVIAGAKIACDFDVPAPPDGQTLDLTTVVTSFTPSAGAPVDFQQVADATACAPNKFYIASNKIVLCPDTCSTVQADAAGAIKIKFGCAIKGAN